MPLNSKVKPRRRISQEELGRCLEENPRKPGDVDSFMGGRDALTRFSDSLRQGLRMFGDNRYNIYVAGMDKPGSLEVVANYTKRVVVKLSKNGSAVFPELEDYCYVFNFDDPENPSPRLISLQRGNGQILSKMMQELLGCLQEEMPLVVASDAVKAVSSNLAQELEEWSLAEQAKIEAKAAKDDIIVEFTPNQFMMGINISIEPGNRVGGKLVKYGPKKLNDFRGSLSEEQSAEIDRKVEKYQRMISSYFNERSRKAIDSKKAFKKILEKEVSSFCETAYRDFRQSFVQKCGAPQLTRIEHFLTGLQEYTNISYGIFLPKNGEEKGLMESFMAQDAFVPWKVNVAVDNGLTRGIPIVVEDNPTYENLVGNVGMKLKMGGVMVTDHTKICAGSIIKANGGCLIVFFEDLLRYPAAFHALFESIKNKKLYIKDMASSMGYDSYSSLRPEPMPLNLRVIICGSRSYWYLLNEFRPDVIHFFEAKAEIPHFVEATPENISLYAAWLKQFTLKKGLSSLDDSAVCRLIEESMRFCDHNARLSTNLETVKRIMVEASDRPSKTGVNASLSASDIVKTLDQRFWRRSFVYEMMKRQIADGKKIINVSGEKVGELNGLVVSDFGDIQIGSPCRITASVYPSVKLGMVTIEREAKLSGSIFNKADFTVREFLKGRYARLAPLALGISFAFEQSYYGIDGDSASLAELYSILSAISEIPLKQSVAITGSMSLRGDVQPIGGVNEKIEGFFDICKMMDVLNDNHGVIIPHQNVDDLMLRDDVSEAIESGKFNLWPIKTIDEGARILMNQALEAVDSKVVGALKEFAKITKSFGKDKEEDD
ncbi:MAG: AAA family ATPase [Patescibacteria group bacterium]